eukprot:2305689-Amphidinium_carterae.2
MPALFTDGPEISRRSPSPSNLPPVMTCSYQRATSWRHTLYQTPLVEVDIIRGPLHDLLTNTKLAAELQRRAQAGDILAVLGGPNCRAWSRLCFHTPGPQKRE